MSAGFCGLPTWRPISSKRSSKAANPIIGEAANTVIAAVFAVLVSLNLVTAAVLLLFTFLMSAFGAFTAPAWQAVTPQLVPKQDLPAAIAANSIGKRAARESGSGVRLFLPGPQFRRNSGRARCP
jgi:hypothetical protein